CFFSSRRRHTRFSRDWSSDVCSSDLADWAHLLGNLVFLLIFGLPAERAMGPWRFLVLFLVGGAVANLAAVVVIDDPHRAVIGAKIGRASWRERVQRAGGSGAGEEHKG